VPPWLVAGSLYLSFINIYKKQLIEREEKERKGRRKRTKKRLAKRKKRRPNHMQELRCPGVTTFIKTHPMRTRLDVDRVNCGA
jgi:hypothetical protein